MEVYRNVGEYFRVLEGLGEVSDPIEKEHDPHDQGNGIGWGSDRSPEVPGQGNQEDD